MKTNGMPLWALAALVVAGAALSAHGEYTMHGRVSYDGGATLVRGAEEADWSFATVNTLVLPGDVIWADKGGMLELELPRGVFLRMADATKVELVGLEPGAVLRGWQGSYYVQRLSRSAGDFRFVTPACTVEIQPDSAVRIDVVGDGATTVTVRWGRALVRTDQSDVTILETGRRAWVYPGFMPSFPAAFDRAGDDAFDRWNRERAERLATGGRVTPTPRPVDDDVIGLADLDNYGDWVIVDSQPVWRPTVVVDYVPYRYGRWSYTVGIGNVWVGHYPFAYTTSHYGRWNYTSHYGWVWAYDPVWSPAWAATIRCGDYFVWSPIGYGYEPVYTSGWSYFSYGGLRFGHYATSYVLASDLYGDYGYVHYADPRIFTEGFFAINQPSIWRIHQGPHPGRYGYIPYRGNGLRYASYTPNRTLRGLTTLRGADREARDHARQLEGRSGRSDFRRVAVNSRRGQRTASGTRDRSARVRTLRIARETPSYERATRTKPENALRARDTVRRTRERPAGDRGNGETRVARRVGGDDGRMTIRPVRESSSNTRVYRPVRTPIAETRVRREVRRTTSDSGRGTVHSTESTSRRTPASSRTTARTMVRRETRTGEAGVASRADSRITRRETSGDGERTSAPTRITTRRPVVNTTGANNGSSRAAHGPTRDNTRTNLSRTMTRREVSRTEPRSSGTARTPSQTPVRRSIPTTTSRTRTPSTHTREATSPRRTITRREVTPRPSVRSTPATSPRSSRPSPPPSVTRSRPAPSFPARSGRSGASRSSRPAEPPSISRGTSFSRPSAARSGTHGGSRSFSTSGRSGGSRGGRR